jgi:hypothetical protein
MNCRRNPTASVDRTGQATCPARGPASCAMDRASCAPPWRAFLGEPVKNARHTRVNPKPRQSPYREQSVLTRRFGPSFITLI